MTTMLTIVIKVLVWAGMGFALTAGMNLALFILGFLCRGMRNSFHAGWNWGVK